MLAAKRSTLILRVGKAARLQCRDDRVHHALRGRTRTRYRCPRPEIHFCEQQIGLGAIDAAVQQFDILRLARQHVDQVEAARGCVSLSAASSSLNITVPEARLP